MRIASATHRWRRRILGTIVAIALILVGGAGGWWWANRGTSSAAAATVRTQLVAASLGTIKQTVAASGTIEPATQSTVSFSSAGTVTAVDVAVGDTVQKGQTLATIGDTSLANAVTLAQAGVTAAQDQVNSATTSSAIASAKAQLASAQSTLADAQTALAGARLTSPISGTVAGVGLAVGDTVGSSGGGGLGGGTGASGAGASGTSGASGSSSSSSIVVVDTSAWVVNATVSSSSLASLKKGLQATITPSGGSTPVFGTVSSVGVVATSSSSGAAQFPVVIDVTGSPTGLHAGTTADVAITVKQLTSVLTVPTLAVHTSTNGQTTVQVQKNGQTSSVDVTIGEVSGSLTQITKGLSEGDEVVVQTRTLGAVPTGGPGTGGRSFTGFGGAGGFGGGGFPGGGFQGRTQGGGAP